MKRRHDRYILRILLTAALLMIAAVMGASYAADRNVNGSCYYDGGKTIKSDFSTDAFYSDVFKGLEPGDSVEIKVTYTNKTDKPTDWYLRNTVLQSLEDKKDRAKNGGYTYTLKNKTAAGTETTLFDNSAVGGESRAGGLVGLHQATNATGEYFYIDTLEAGQTGTTSLYVKLDGETGVNSYMDTEGTLQLSYAVEEKTPDKAAAGKKKTTAATGGNGTQTGDSAHPLWMILCMAAALILAVLTILSWRRDRRKGGEQA